MTLPNGRWPILFFANSAENVKDVELAAHAQSSGSESFPGFGIRRGSKLRVQAMAEKDNEIDDDLPDEVIYSLEDFYRSMNTVEESLEPILSLSSENVHEKVCFRLQNCSQSKFGI